MKARTAGECSICGRRYERNADVRRDPDGGGGLAHQLCVRRSRRQA